MSPNKTFCFLVLAGAFQVACIEAPAKSRLDEPDASQATEGGDAHAEKPESSQSLVVGSWRQNDPAPGYEAYLRVDANGEGRLCNADGKSEAFFEVMFKGRTAATMGAYGHGGGDRLKTNSAGASLTREGDDKGERYVDTFTRVMEVPAWCEEQFNTLGKSSEG